MYSPVVIVCEDSSAESETETVEESESSASSAMGSFVNEPREEGRSKGGFCVGCEEAQADNSKSSASGSDKESSSVAESSSSSGG